MVAVDCEAFQHELPDLIYGEVDPEVRPALDDHRRGCSSCDALVVELEAVRQSLPPLRPPPLLQARIKLAARDELLAAAGAGPAPAPPIGPTLHLAAACVLAACVGIVGFVLGTTWDRRPADGDDPRLPVPRGATDIGREPALPPGSGGSTEPEPPGRHGPVPRAPEAWQRVLYDAAVARVRAGNDAEAAEFFRRAAAVAQEGPLAAAANVGLAELLLKQGKKAEAKALLEETRRAILGGKLVGGPALLQKIAELSQDL